MPQRECSIYPDGQHRLVFQGERAGDDIFKCACSESEFRNANDWPEHPPIIEPDEEAELLGAVRA